MSDPQGILDELSAKYISLESYQDSGRVLYTLNDGESPNEVKFKTFFRRPDSFRFDWVTHHPYYKLHDLKTTCVLWSVDGFTKRYSDRDHFIGDEDSLHMGIAGATGVSHGAAYLIPSLFLPNSSYGKVTEIQDLAYDEKDLRGRTHIVISGVHPRGFPYAITISPDMVITQVQDESSTTIFDSVEVDETIDDSAFHFEPPA